MTTRIARWNGTCGNPDCRHPQIWPGTRITQPPGRAWRHADCSKPARRPQADRDAEHAPRR